MQPYAQPPPFHSQWGEDRWLAEHFELPRLGVFVDVGAGDGITGSNSLYFENLGWRGLCVDADPRNHEQLRRRRCAVHTCAIAATPGPRILGLYIPKPSRSGLDHRGKDYRPMLVNCHTLEDLLQQEQIEQIDVLSIDVEGTELDVWESFDHHQRRPAVVIIEYDDRHPDRHRTLIHTRIGADIYELVHETPANLIFQAVDRRWQKRALPGAEGDSGRT